jgi:hypothetical protein
MSAGRLRGGLIAPAARRWLSEAQAPALHNLYRRSLNLVNENGELMSLVLQELGPGPFALVVHPVQTGFLTSGGFSGKLRVEDAVQLDESRLTIGNLHVSLANLPQWKPRPSWERVGRDHLQPALEALSEILEEHAPEGSFAPLVGTLRKEAGDGVNAAALRAATGPVGKLTEGLQDRDGTQIASAAGKLAGLGGGVTPSGDDFLMGAMHALWMLLDQGEAKRLAAVIAENAVPRTNAISGAWLKAAARGEAGSEWHVLVFELVGGGPLNDVAAWLILRGHTSGADAMAGFISAAQVLIN